MGKGIQKRHIALTFSLFVGIVAVVLIVNLNDAVTVQQQTTFVNGINQTNIIKTCAPNPVIINGVCQLSTNQGKPNTNVCANGGIPTQIGSNGTYVCPASVVQLPANTTIQQCATGFTLSGTTCIANTPLPSNYESVQLKPNVVFVDNNGVQTSAQVLARTYQLGSLVSPQGTSTPLDHGNILLAIMIKATPNEKIIANGTLFVSINGMQLHSQGLPWAINNFTDSTGLVSALIQSQTNVLSNYNLIIGNNLNSLQQPSNNVTFSISNLSIQNQKGQSFKVATAQSLYSVLLDYDANKVITQNADGSYSRVYPADGTFTIASNGRTIQYVTHPTSYKCGCGDTVVYSTTPGVTAGIANVYLEGESAGFEKLIGSTGSITSGNSQTISNIPRNSDIRIVITGGYSTMDKIIHTGITQESHSFTCDTSSCSFN